MKNPKTRVGAPWGTLHPLVNNGINKCIRCNVKLTKKNKSDWEDVIEGTDRSQCVCKNCLAPEEKGVVEQ